MHHISRHSSFFGVCVLFIIYYSKLLKRIIYITQDILYLNIIPAHVALRAHFFSDAFKVDALWGEQIRFGSAQDCGQLRSSDDTEKLNLAFQTRLRAGRKIRILPWRWSIEHEFVQTNQPYFSILFIWVTSYWEYFGQFIDHQFHILEYKSLQFLVNVHIS